MQSSTRQHASGPHAAASSPDPRTTTQRAQRIRASCSERRETRSTRRATAFEAIAHVRKCSLPADRAERLLCHPDNGLYKFIPNDVSLWEQHCLKDLWVGTENWICAHQERLKTRTSSLCWTFMAAGNQTPAFPCGFQTIAQIDQPERSRGGAGGTAPAGRPRGRGAQSQDFAITCICLQTFTHKGRRNDRQKRHQTSDEGYREELSSGVSRRTGSEAGRGKSPRSCAPSGRGAETQGS